MFEEFFEGLYEADINYECGMANMPDYINSGSFGYGDGVNGNGEGNGFACDTNAFGNGGNESFNDILDQDDLED